MDRREFIIRSARTIGASLLAPIALRSLAEAAGDSQAKVARFVIISDTHNHDGVDRMVREIIDLHPPFVIGVGDMTHLFGGPDAIRRIREAGIEFNNAMGNHDGGMRPQLRHGLPPWLCTGVINQTQRFAVDNQFYYSFNRWGIHFVILDTCTDNIEREIQWMEDDLGRHVNNPSKLPALVFMHYPDWIVKEGTTKDGPLFILLKKYRAEHTIKAILAGHVHDGRNYPLEQTVGVPFYTLFPSAPFCDVLHTEYVVVTVTPDSIDFERKIILDHGGANKYTIYPVAGHFTPSGA
jgi:hypothetical protein